MCYSEAHAPVDRNNVDASFCQVNNKASEFPAFKHAIVVFGGPKGLEHYFETCLELDENSLKEKFHFYLNMCPHQGSRTIRSEEAIWISLARLQHQLSWCT